MLRVIRVCREIDFSLEMADVVQTSYGQNEKNIQTKNFTFFEQIFDFKRKMIHIFICQFVFASGVCFYFIF